MLNRKTILIFIFNCIIILSSCKKYDTLPDLGIGNNMNPKAGVEYVQLDSTRIYNSSGKILKSYISVKANLITEMGKTYTRVNVYKNGSMTTYFNSSSPNKFFLDNVVSGQVLKFEFTLIDDVGRESKKSIPYVVTIP